MSEFLKCDAPGCTHVSDVEAITEDMIGTPCPVCGASLLTREDFDVWQVVFKPAIEASHAAGLTRDSSPDDVGHDRVRINWHDGELRVKAITATDKASTQRTEISI